MFYIEVSISDEKTKNIQKYSNLFAWEISKAEKLKAMINVDIYVNECIAFIQVMQHYYDDIYDLHWVHTDKKKHPTPNNWNNCLKSDDKIKMMNLNQRLN